MSRALIVITTALMLSAAPTVALANEEAAAAGAVTGAVAGAVVGGPIGAVIGAVVGGVAVGAATDPGSEANAQVQGPPTAPAGQRVLGTAFPEPATTGTVVETRTCVRDAQGVARCRRDPAR
jgi:phage tail tape-measure protein